MTCYHPLLAEKIHPTRRQLWNKGKKIKIYKNDGYMDIALPQRDSTNLSEFFYVPCGRCIGCRIDQARDWSVRLMCESYTSSSSWFLTLTFDDDHFGDLTLRKKDVQEFIQNLRNTVCKYNPDVKLRYFACGEYGDKSGRKHYHIIIFNLPKLDMVPQTVSKGNILYSSEIINNVWKKGYVVIGAVTPESCQYVARYTLKKQGLKDYTDLGIESPFLLMSKRPGIGYDYCMNNKERLTTDWKICIGHDYAHVPRYFMRILEDDDYYGKRVKEHKEDLKDLSFDKKFMKQLLNSRNINQILTSEEINKLKELEQNARDSL